MLEKHRGAMTHPIGYVHPVGTLCCLRTRCHLWRSQWWRDPVERHGVLIATLQERSLVFVLASMPKDDVYEPCYLLLSSSTFTVIGWAPAPFMRAIMIEEAMSL